MEKKDKPYLFISGNIKDLQSKEFQGEREIDTIAQAIDFLVAEYAKRKGPDDPARVIREE